MIQPHHPRDGGTFYWTSMDQRDGIQSPMESLSLSSFHGEDCRPQRAAFHQNFEQFADQIGLIVGWLGNRKVSQEEAYEQTKELWSQRKGSRKDLLDQQHLLS